MDILLNRQIKIEFPQITYNGYVGESVGNPVGQVIVGLERYTDDEITSYNNIQIDADSINISRVLCSGNIQYGEMNSSCLTATIYTNIVPTKKYIKVIQYDTYPSGDTQTECLFTGYIDDCSSSFDSNKLEITAYDINYWLKDFDVSQFWTMFWINGYTKVSEGITGWNRQDYKLYAETTVNNLLIAFFDYLYRATGYINDVNPTNLTLTTLNASMTVHQLIASSDEHTIVNTRNDAVTFSSITASNVLRELGEIQCTFPVVMPMETDCAYLMLPLSPHDLYKDGTTIISGAKSDYLQSTYINIDENCININDNNHYIQSVNCIEFSNSSISVDDIVDIDNVAVYMDGNMSCQTNPLGHNVYIYEDISLFCYKTYIELLTFAQTMQAELLSFYPRYVSDDPVTVRYPIGTISFIYMNPIALRLGNIISINTLDANGNDLIIFIPVLQSNISGVMLTTTSITMSGDVTYINSSVGSNYTSGGSSVSTGHTSDSISSDIKRSLNQLTTAQNELSTQFTTFKDTINNKIESLNYAILNLQKNTGSGLGCNYISDDEMLLFN